MILSKILLLKPFKIAVQFADTFRLPVTIRFNGPKKPLVILMGNSSFTVEFMIAAILIGDDCSQSDEEESSETDEVESPKRVNSSRNTSKSKRMNRTSQLMDDAYLDLNITNMALVQDFNLDPGAIPETVIDPDPHPVADLNSKIAVDPEPDPESDNEEVLSERDLRSKWIFSRCFDDYNETESEIVESDEEIIAENSVWSNSNKSLF